MSTTDPNQTRCAVCSATSSPLWRRNEEDAVVCLDCHSASKKAQNDKSTSPIVATSVGSPSETVSNNTQRKKKNNKKAKNDKAGKLNNSSLANRVNKVTYRGRRSITKETPIKSPAPEPGLLTTNSVSHKGVAYQIGDVVSVMDYSGGVYYAIIRGLLVDQYSMKYAMLTWVLPKRPHPVEFDPVNFILGPEEAEPRSLDVLEFVCHSPRSSCYALSTQYDPDLAAMWTAPIMTSSHNDTN